MFRAFATLACLTTLAACGSSDLPTAPTDPSTPEEFTEQFTGTLTVNGGRTHTFPVQRAGNITAQLVSLDPDDGTTVGFLLGTWNGVTCQRVLINDNAQPGQSIVGTATATGNYCVHIYDAGRLTQPLGYTITVRHF